MRRMTGNVLDERATEKATSGGSRDTLKND